MPSTILVTGATGNVGGKVVKQLTAVGAKVRAAVQPTSKVDSIKATGAELVELDFNKPETLRAAFKGVDKVFLLTPFVPNMVELGTQAIEQAKRAGVKHIVRMSAMGADATPGIQLGRWHREVETRLEASAIPLTILRPNSFMQNYANMLGHSIKTQSAFYLPMGDGKVSIVDTRDIAAVAVEALTKTDMRGGLMKLPDPKRSPIIKWLRFYRRSQIGR